jgi:site-specific recombinase XerC
MRRDRPGATIKYLKPEELGRPVSVISDRRDRAIFIISYRYALRSSEVGTLHIRNGNLTRAHLNSKGSKARSASSTRYKPTKCGSRKKVIGGSRRDDSRFLVESNRATPISRQMLDVLMQRRGDRIGSPADKQPCHAFASHLATDPLRVGAELCWMKGESRPIPTFRARSSAAHLRGP